ncbi:MAG: ABC transporter ATP-binding protein, partial [Clostridia bacterium]|nr:ABC transporter ATP-binding protein [Clostridia bacterium]
PETGMVFILGKSGSGKSTLLNVCGGLDKADSGEIIIKGKSSNEFSGQDFDSYRNTYVGFVFQDYNILDEFSVEQNIALALELQNKKPDKASIDKILDDVDLKDFATRKPNTLSGGQKQRVAIARALVKEPEIIMADEPTGALDSKTGQQVFDTLKKLSQNKLVLVISHDRDFAEQYGDRIIELKDGKILSDQTRTEEDASAKNVRFFGTDTVCVANGSEVTDEDLQNIKKFLNKSGGAAVISTSREHIANIKESRPEINVGSFENIKEQPVSKTYEKQSLIRSHLPARHAIKMGANSLKSKPVRLVFTIFLSIVAFILFGLASTLMLFDGKSVTVQTFVDSDDQYMILSKGYYGKYTSYVNGEVQYQESNASKRATSYTVDEYKELVKKYNGAIAVADVKGRLDNIRMGQYATQYYSEYIKSAILDNDNIEIISGKRPSAVDEIAISDYVYESLSLPKTKFTDSKNNEITISKPEDILYSDTNKVTLKISDNNFKVVGIFKLETPSSEFDELKNAAKENKLFAGSESVAEKWEQYLELSLLPSVMVNEDLLKQLGASSSDQYIYAYDYFNYTQGELKIWCADEEGWQGSVYYVNKYGEESLYPLFDLYDFSGNKVTALSGGSVAMPANLAGTLYYEAYNEYKNDLERSSAEQEKIYAEERAAKAAYEIEHLLIDKYFQEDTFNYAVQYWQNDLEYARNQAQANGEEFDEAAYRLEFPEPQKTDKYEYEDYDYYSYKYYSGESEYEQAYNDYMNVVYQTAGTLKAYKTLIYNARHTAYEKFIAENPEPMRPDDATKEEMD